jgi:hypothetical protein
MEPTPDTTFYMNLGYAVFFIVSAIYLVSLFLRDRNLKRDLETLEEMQKKN